MYQEDINIMIGASKYIRKILENVKKEIDSNTFIHQGILTPHCQKWVDLPKKLSTRTLWL